MSRVFLGLGSNLGDREGYLKQAVEAVARFESTKIEQISSIYETEPWGRKDQGDFLNMAICIETTLSPESIRDKCFEVERRLGRLKRLKWDEREIDIDLILFDTIQIDSEKLQIPHPRMMERKFVLKPLCELSPSQVIPCSNITFEEAYKQCEDQGRMVLYKSVEKIQWRRQL